MLHTHLRISYLTAAVSAALSLQSFAAPYQFNSPFSPTPEQGQTQAPVSPAGFGVIPGEDRPEGLTGPQATFWKKDTLTGDWGDFRNQLLYKGIAITPIFQGEVFGNSGGADQGVISDGLFNIAVDLDLERLTGSFWKDATIHSNVLYVYGNSLSGKYIGDFSNTSNLAAYNSIRLQELWLEQSLWDKRASIRVGMMAADTEFFTSDSSALFINGTLGAFTLIGANFTNAPVYPLSSPGVRLFVQPVSNFYFRAAAFGMDSNADPAGNNNHGTHFHINDADGALLMFEMGYLVNQSPNDRGLVGTYKAGSFVQRGQYSTWNSQARDALGTGSLSGTGTNCAFYGVLDQEIYKTGGKTISIFARGGFAPSRYSFVDGYFDAGFNFTGFVPGRPQDVAGIAVARSAISKEFSDADVLQGNPPSTSETVIEATYKVNIAPFWSIQPDIQYIVNPSGVKNSTDAFVVGLRTTVAF
jgi:porin